MQSTRLASIRFLRIFPSPDWFADMDPLARTNPAVPRGARWYRPCAVPTRSWHCPPAATPYSHRLSFCVRSLTKPFGVVEVRIGEDVVGPQSRGGGRCGSCRRGLDPALYAPNGQVHPGHSPGGVVRLLTVDGDVRLWLFRRSRFHWLMSADELNRLNEHTGGAATGVVHPAVDRVRSSVPRGEPHERGV